MIRCSETTFFRNQQLLSILLVVFFAAIAPTAMAQQKANKEQSHPNIVIINADDLGYGDVSCYGATKIKTPNIDRIAAQGLRFTNAYASSATCTPSRYSLLTGKYAWRQKGTGIARGNASLLIPTDITTLPAMLQEAGYKTAAVGKWHLGLGPKEGPDWNGVIKPGPLEIGFDYCFLLPATGDRVPCVYLENHRIVNLDPSDPIQVSYDKKVGNEPTGRDHPELLKMKYSQGHDMTIVNGISRIGYMSGGKAALWVDEEISHVITGKAIDFMKENRQGPFFLYFATHDIHVPRVPHPDFVGKSGMGPRGDAILELDWSVGKIMDALDEMHVADNTILIFMSDNGPVVDDGYQDRAVELLGGHTPAGDLRGGKYSAFEGGTRIPFVVRWPGNVKPGTSDVMISQIDLYASFAALTGQKMTGNDGPDSYNNLKALLGKSGRGRPYIVEQSLNNTLSIVQGQWKYITPSDGPKMNVYTGIELGNDLRKQLYDIESDPGETKNVAGDHPEIVRKLEGLLQSVVNNQTLTE